LVDAQTQRVNLHVGTMGWSYGFWKGSFYPSDLTSEDFLSFYSKRFDTVEVDSTFYRIPRVQTVIDWKRQAPENFLFSLKFPKKVTHLKMLRDCQEETSVFLERASLLEEKLGAFLLQFPPMFGQEHLPLLRSYLRTLPEGNRYAVEVRNKVLFNDELYALLKEHNVALVWVDATKSLLSTEVTADFLYIRWEGDRKTVSGTIGKREIDRSEQIQQWGDILKALLKRGKPILGYYSKYYSGFPPSDVEDLLKCISI